MNEAAKGTGHYVSNPTWEYEGIEGSGTKPDCVGKHNGKCIIVAGASNVYTDHEAALQLIDNGEHTMLAVNDIGCFIRGHVHAIVTSNPEWTIGWLKWRTSPQHSAYGIGNKPLVYSMQDSKYVDVRWEGMGASLGSSGMVACLIAICMGFNKIILCGMPMDKSPHFFCPYITTTYPDIDRKTTASWEYATSKLPTFSKKIRSMSGNTKRWLGAPDAEWLNAN